mmetsp:Transcript_18131/g.45660  ORF Transcript_18131/g.45660 Transcript_18131/m.45660 type:complete len:333 (+) Transcript_18131:325-1323(+)
MMMPVAACPSAPTCLLLSFSAAWISCRLCTSCAARLAVYSFCSLSTSGSSSLARCAATLASAALVAASSSVARASRDSSGCCHRWPRDTCTRATWPTMRDSRVAWSLHPMSVGSSAHAAMTFCTAMSALDSAAVSSSLDAGSMCGSRSSPPDVAPSSSIAAAPSATGGTTLPSGGMGGLDLDRSSRCLVSMATCAAATLAAAVGTTRPVAPAVGKAAGALPLLGGLPCPLCPDPLSLPCPSSRDHRDAWCSLPATGGDVPSPPALLAARVEDPDLTGLLGALGGLLPNSMLSRLLPLTRRSGEGRRGGLVGGRPSRSGPTACTISCRACASS